eukprot:284728-Ditylum_brightwellii.AAC.1
MSTSTRPTVLNTKIEELQEDTTMKFAAMDNAFKELKETTSSMKKNHNDQLSEIKEMLKALDTQISNTSIKSAVIKVVPDVITKEMEKQVPQIVKEGITQLNQQQNHLVQNQMPNFQLGPIQMPTTPMVWNPSMLVSQSQGSPQFFPCKILDNKRWYLHNNKI